MIPAPTIITSAPEAAPVLRARVGARPVLKSRPLRSEPIDVLAFAKNDILAAALAFGARSLFRASAQPAKRVPMGDFSCASAASGRTSDGATPSTRERLSTSSVFDRT